MNSTTFSVGKYRCTMSFVGGGIKTEWFPGMPKNLSADEWRQYRLGRDTFIALALPGVEFAVVEI